MMGRNAGCTYRYYVFLPHLAEDATPTIIVIMSLCIIITIVLLCVARRPFVLEHATELECYIRRMSRDDTISLQQLFAVEPPPLILDANRKYQSTYREKKSQRFSKYPNHCCRFVFKLTLGEYVRRNCSSQWRNLWEGACW
uniref:Uncharacterized protein n=1 Tax=Schizaphis graminum TaxID=13262 RepID=A0A2S2PG96_SCHGA